MKSRKEVAAATMKDVAQKAQVSTATVSRALMNPDKVSQATRNRVEQAALEVGYFPQAMGRNVKRNESRTILVIVPDICDPFFSEIIRGIEVTAAEQGYLVLIGDCAHQNQQEKTFIDLIITKQIDGMLLLGSRLPFDASIEEQRNLPPMVMANEFAPELELPTVHIDNLTAAFNAVNYLQELGHKRIGCIAGPEEMPLCHYRLQGYVQALRRTGVTVDPHYIARGDFTFAAGGQALERGLDAEQILEVLARGGQILLLAGTVDDQLALGLCRGDQILHAVEILGIGSGVAIAAALLRVIGRRLVTAGDQTQRHDQRQQKCEKLLHSIFLRSRFSKVAFE